MIKESFVFLGVLSFFLLVFVLYWGFTSFEEGDLKKKEGKWPLTIALLIGGSLLFFPKNTVLSSEFYSPKLILEFILYSFGEKNAIREDVFVLNRHALPKLHSSLPKKNQSNILIVRLEEVSSRKVGLYSTVKTTPFLSAFQSQYPNNFFVFQHHFSNSGATDVSVPILYTGLSPTRSGKEFGFFPIIWDYARALDYYTFYIIPFRLSWGSLDKKLAFKEGFFSVNYLFHAGNYNGDYTYDYSLHDDIVVEQCIRQLSEAKKYEKLFFGIVNIKLPHRFGKHLRQIKHQRVPHMPGDPPVHLYERAIYDNDYQFMKLFLALEKEKLLENTIVIAVSDHGSDLNMRRDRLLNYFQEVLHVPFFVYLPDQFVDWLSKNRRGWQENLSKPSNNVDLVPSVIDVLGISDQKPISFILDQLDGRSVFSDASATPFFVALNTNALRRWQPEGFSVILDGRYKYILDENRPYLFDLNRDPNENHNMMTMPQIAMQPFYKRIHAYIRQTPKLREIYAKSFEPKKKYLDAP